MMVTNCSTSAHPDDDLVIPWLLTRSKYCNG